MPDAPTRPSLSRAVVRARNVQMADHAIAVGKPLPVTLKPEPRIDIIRDGNLIRAVDVICTCGEHIRVRLDYE